MHELMVDAAHSPAPAWTRVLEDYPTAIAVSPDGAHVAVAGGSGAIAVIATGDGAVVSNPAGHQVATTSLDWIDDRTLVSGGHDGTARVWSAGGHVLAEVDAGATWVERVAALWDRGAFATAAGRHVRLWSRDGAPLAAWPLRPSTVLDLAWRPQSAARPLLGAVHYGGVSLFEPHRPNAVRELSWQGSSLVLAWSPDGRKIATGDQDASVHFWDVRSGRDLMMSGYPRKVREIAWRHDGARLATGGGAWPCIWNTSRSPAGTEPRMLEFHELPLSVLAWQPGNDRLASGDEAGYVALWEPESRDAPLAVYSGTAAVTALRWCRLGVIVAYADGTIARFDAG